MTVSASDFRREIASRCCWLLVLAFSTSETLSSKLRSRENRASDIDRIVERQRADHLRRRIRDRREPVGERHACGQLDIGDEMAEYTVEHRNMIVGKMARSKNEKIGDAAKRLDAPLGRAVRERLFKLVDDGVFGCH